MKIKDIILWESLKIISTLSTQLFMPRGNVSIYESLKPDAVLWTSTAKQIESGWTSEWVEWCSYQMPQWMSSMGVIYDVEPGARILNINTDNDAIVVAEHYGIKINNNRLIKYVDLITKMPWDLIKNDWDAIHHVPENRHSNMYMSSWDVESTAWFNKKFLINPRKVQIGIDSLDIDDSELQEASGYIPTASERNDPRFKTGLTVDVNPYSIQQNASKLSLGHIKRSGIPITARSDGKINRVSKSTK